jgi:hypothetical protein
MLVKCIECKYHKIINDRDPDDWFCDDDVAVICLLTKNDKRKTNSKYISDNSEHRCITVACRPHHVSKETNIPDWCPLDNRYV